MIDVIGDGSYRKTLEQNAKIFLEDRVIFSNGKTTLIQDSDVIVSSGTSLTYLSSSEFLVLSH